MQVIAWHVDAAQVVWGKEADYGALDVVELEDWLFARRVLESD